MPTLPPTFAAPGTTRLPWRVSVAPMMDWTDRHCRYFLRQLSPDTGLYTEMITASAVVHGDRDFLLRIDPSEAPVALQLGGSDPQLLARAAAIAVPYGYHEVNLNVGCPSPRVAEGSFGACLMKSPSVVAESVAAMAAAVAVPVTVKTRIGVDDMEGYEALAAFVEQVAAGGCTTFIIHARKAYLAGLSPKENRTVPPLQYDLAYRLKADFPALTVVLNGGIQTVASVRTHLDQLDGVMIGRQAYGEPWLLAELQAAGLTAHRPSIGWTPPERSEVILRMADYADREIAVGARLNHISRHMLGLCHGLPGARRWRQFLSTAATRPGATGQVLRDSLRFLEAAPLPLSA